MLGLWLLYYFRFWAKLQLKKVSPDIIGITGSAGKTSCRNAVEAILREKYPIKISYKANSESGIPLNILGLTPNTFSLFGWFRLLLLAPIKLITENSRYQKYVVEMGIDSPQQPKNMEYLLTILQPRTGIFLNALPVHSEAFDTLVKEKDPEKRKEKVVDAIAHEKGKLIRSLPHNGLAILNRDDERVMREALTIAPSMTFGAHKESDLVIEKVSYTIKGTVFSYRFKDQSAKVYMASMLLPAHYAYSLGAAILVGLDEDYSLEECALLLEKHFHLPPSRMSLLAGLSGSKILDSSYNASARTMLDALRMLKRVRAPRRLALLGDMRELGKEAKVEHLAVAEELLTAADEVFLVGPLMRAYVLPYLKKHKKPVQWLVDADKAGAVVGDKLKKGDIILVKGSQNTLFLEAAVKKMMKNPQEADKLLCRQGAYWQKRRRASGLSE